MIRVQALNIENPTSQNDMEVLENVEENGGEW